jgi:hypothetical protein
MKTLVVTSINPYAKIEYQKICFQKWKLAGVEVKTFNTKKESELLLRLAVEEKDIFNINVDESGLYLFNKQMPRILPLLNRMASTDFDSYILVNSDIYPAVNNNPAKLLANYGDLICLTRNECVAVSSHQYIDSTPYRGGIDAFFFTRNGIQLVIDSLTKKIVSERMTLGIPGWDYFLAHYALELNQDAILDSEVFLHQSHKTTYGEIDEFSCYANEMIDSGQYVSKNAIELASEFARKIDIIANKNREKSNLIKKILYSQSRSDTDAEATHDEQVLIARIHKRLEDVGYSIRSSKKFLSFLRSQYDGISWSVAVSYVESEFWCEKKKNRLLIAILIMLLLREYFGLIGYVKNYPKGNLHGLALNQILSNTKGAVQYEYILGLFGSELIDYSIFNPYLFNFIVLSSLSKRDLLLCAEMKKRVLEGNLHVE